MKLLSEIMRCMVRKVKDELELKFVEARKGGEKMSGVRLTPPANKVLISSNDTAGAYN